MTGTLPTVTELNGLVTPEKLAEAGFRKPRRVIVKEVSLEDGTEAYEVWVVYPNTVKEEELGLRKTQPMRDWIFKALRNALREERWPYVRLVRSDHFPSAVAT